MFIQILLELLEVQRVPLLVLPQVWRVLLQAVVGQVDVGLRKVKRVLLGACS